MKYWEIIADNLNLAGWNCGCISRTDDEGRQFWVVAAEHEDAGRFIVRADEKLTAFLEAESAIRGCRIVLTSRRDFFKLGGAKPILIGRRTFPPLGSLPVPDEIVREHFPVLHRQGCV